MLSPTDQLRSADNALVPDARSVSTVLGQIELFKRKPDLASRSLKNPYKSKGCVFNGKPTLSVITQMQGSVTNSRLQEITGEHAKDITGVLQNLVRDGLLTQQNQRRWASYRLAEDSPQSVEDSPHLAGGSPQSSPQLQSDSPQLDGDSPQLDRLARLSDEVLALLPMAEPARKNKKLPVEQLQALIAQLCAGRWLSTSELAALVHRDADKLRSRFLTAMVRRGVLELKYPEVRNRPDQAYRTVSAANL